LSQLFVEAVTQSRLNLKTINAKITLDSYTMHIFYLLLFHLQLDNIRKIAKQNKLTKKPRLPIRHVNIGLNWTMSTKVGSEIIEVES